jgi:AraC family transcriptional activator of pobA
MGRGSAGGLAQSVPDLPVDVFEAPDASLEVVLLDGQEYPEDGVCGSQRPHRHAYHELIWSRRGSGSHLIDGQRSLVEEQLVTVIGRGQVHIFERGVGIDGAIVRFGDEMLQVESVARANPSWLVGFQGPHSVLVPDEAVSHLDGLVLALAEEAQQPADSRSVDVQRHLLCTLLLWVERWNDAARRDHRDADDSTLQLYRRFVDVLERDFTRRHGAREYADELGVPQAALSRALAAVTGRRTKELITDRRMLEAARLLRFTDRAIGDVASRAGFDDQLYFSRSFKRYYGTAPSEYRERVRGR